MMPTASIYGPGCNSQMLTSTQSDASVEVVSVVAAGVAYPEMNSVREIAVALRAGRQLWQGKEPRRLDLQQLHEAAGIEPRAARKLDRFSLLALAAARGAVSQSKLQPDAMAGCGIYSGNMVGGWTFTEPQVRALHRDGLDAVSPYLATAWFPGAPQGQISINLGMMGFAKTVTTDRCSGAQAIGLAYERIRAGLHPALLLAGGAEAPLTPFVAASLAQIVKHHEAVMEGAAYLLLAPGCAGDVQISGHDTFPINTRLDDFVERAATRIEQLIERTGDGSPDFVFCNIPIDTMLEDAVGKCIRGAIGKQTEIFFTTQIFGDLLAASGPLASTAAWRTLTEVPLARTALVLSIGHQCADLLVFSKPHNVAQNVVHKTGGNSHDY